jgi:hypothetical protein
MLKPFAWLVLLSVIPIAAQDTPKTIALTRNSTIDATDFSKALQSKSLPRECSNVTSTNDVAKSDYTLEVIGSTGTLFDHDGKTVRSSNSFDSLDKAVKEICHAIHTAVIVEVVETQNLTQSRDARGDTSDGPIAAVVNDTTGRRTHTDASTIYVIVKGEHALLDCYERRTGCSTIGPGKYYGEVDGDGIWVSYVLPITHKQVRNHYKIAGSW